MNNLLVRNIFCFGFVTFAEEHEFVQDCARGHLKSNGSHTKKIGKALFGALCHNAGVSSKMDA